MPNWSSLADFGKTLQGFEHELTEVEARKITREMGKEAQRLAALQAARSLGGDKAFSGWNRGSPIPLDTRLTTSGDSDTFFIPKRQSSAQWTVAESGRHAGGGVGGFQGPSINRRSGRTRRTKAGDVSLRRGRSHASRWNGLTTGKLTGTRTLQDMNRRLPPIANKAVLKVSRKHFDVT